MHGGHKEAILSLSMISPFSYRHRSRRGNLKQKTEEIVDLTFSNGLTTFPALKTGPWAIKFPALMEPHCRIHDSPFCTSGPETSDFADS